MATQTVECLRCGACRSMTDGRAERPDEGECPRCHYLGWALARDLSESTRRRIRRIPPHRRARLYAV